MHDIFLIIPVHNRKEKTISFLKLLNSQSTKSFEIVVVDDGSIDGTGDAIVDKYNDVHIVKGNGNWWWTKSINEGCKYAVENNAKKVILLNDDTFFNVNFLETITSNSIDFPDAVIGNLLLTEEEHPRVFFSGTSKINILTGKETNYLNRFEKFNPVILEKKLRPSIVLTGSGLLIPISVFKKIGFLDEKNFPQYWADFDFVRRANANKIQTLISFNAVTYTEIACTGKGASFVTQSAVDFFNAFFYKYSRNNLVQSFKYFKNHFPMLIFIIPFIIHVLAITKNFIFSRKY